jgi:hypothetical protein
MWQIYYPPLLPDNVYKVIMYIHTNLDCSIVVVNHLTHPMASASSRVLNVITSNETLRLVNIYHQVPHKGGGHALPHLLSSKLDHLVPTLCMGDFNTHSLAWSLDHSTPSPWESNLVKWFDD